MAADLTRRSVGLTPAHRELLKLLAVIAVEGYLQEVEHLNDEQSAVKEVSDHAVH